MLLFVQVEFCTCTYNIDSGTPMHLFSYAVASETVLEAWNIALIVVGISILVAGDVCLTIIASLLIALAEPCCEQIQP